MSPTVRTEPQQAGNAETMESWTTSPLFPLTAAAVGALTTFALLAVDSTPESAIALGLGVFAALMALRNWWVAEEERPLLAEELLGVHDGADSLREETAELRAALTSLAELVEEGVTARDAAPTMGWREVQAMIDDRLAALERRLADNADGTDPASQAALAADMSARAQAAEDKAQKLAKALSIAVREVKRIESRLDALEASRADVAPARGAVAVEEIREHEEAEASRDEVRSGQSPEPEQDPAQGLEERDAEDTEARNDALFALAAELGAGREPRISRTEEAVADVAEAAAPAPDEGPERPDEAAETASSGSEALIQAIVTLPDGAPRFMEAFDNDADQPDAPAAAANGAGRAHLNGAGAKQGERLLARSVAALDELSVHGRETGVFCSLSMANLRDDGFLRALLGHLERRPAMASRLVFGLDQPEIAKASPQDLKVLQQIRQQGFAFALENVVDWKTDIAHLARIGFRFVKLECEALLKREAEAPGAARRLIASFDRVGLELVVENVETEAQREQVGSAGVRLAQGPGLAPQRLIRFEGGEARKPAQPAAALH